jgi:hypothetical protein
MEADTVLNIFSSVGTPVAIIIFICWVAYKYIPKMIDAYTNAKKAEQEAFSKRQEEQFGFLHEA